MARQQFSDYFRNSKFHLIDVSFSFPLVLIPIFGFAACSSPEITLDLADVREGTYEYPRKVNQGKATISTITLRQGVQFINSDMWDWMRKAVVGNVQRRNLLLIQFSNIGLGSDASLGFLGASIDFAPRVPGRAWLLWSAIPGRYKGAGDFDAADSSISVAELDLECEAIFQFDTGV